MFLITPPRARAGWCGPGALNSAAIEQGLGPIDQEKLAPAVGIDGAGTSHEMMVTGATYLGLSAHWVQNQSLDQLNQFKRAGRSIILNWMNGENYNEDGHYSLLSEVSESQIILNDSELTGMIKILRRSDFEKLWFDIDRNGQRYERFALVLFRPPAAVRLSVCSSL